MTVARGHQRDEQGPFSGPPTVQKRRLNWLVGVLNQFTARRLGEALGSPAHLRVVSEHRQGGGKTG